MLLAPRERFGYTTMETLPCGRIIALEGGAAAASTPDSKGV